MGVKWAQAKVSGQLGTSILGALKKKEKDPRHCGFKASIVVAHIPIREISFGLALG